MDTQTMETQKRSITYGLFYAVLICLIFSFSSCKKKTDLAALPTYNESNQLTAVIEIPAGTNKKVEYNKDTQTFIVDKIDGVIKYLPYLGNYGFIPSTLSDLNKGGDGDPLDIIVFAESLPTGTTIPVIPIGVLKIIDEGEEDDKIIAIPVEKSLRIIDAENFKDWSTNFTSTKMMLITWYRNYDSSGQNQIKGYRNEKEAQNVIKKWQL